MARSAPSLAPELGETSRIAKALDNLPTLPIVAMQIGEVIHSKHASVQQVAQILRSDPATSAKLLRLVNSPYFAIPGGVCEIERAIPFVGFNTLYQLVLSVSVLDVLGPRDRHFDPHELWLHALTVGTAARELATDLRLSDPGAAFTAGLLHDMGKIALAKVAPDKLAAVHDSIHRDGLSPDEAELRHALPSHDLLGSRLARQWRFPAMLVTPIEQHHAIERVEVRERLPSQLRTITEIVAVADVVSTRCTTGFTQVTCDDPARDLSALFERNGLGDRRVEALISRTKTALERSKTFLTLLDGRR